MGKGRRDFYLTLVLLSRITEFCSLPPSALYSPRVLLHAPQRKTSH